MPHPPTEPCPCGSGQTLENCCLPYIQGQKAAPSAEALMRSRYTAFTLHEAHYLLKTWHPRTRPPSLELDEVQWIKLEVLSTRQGRPNQQQGQVHFIAHYQQAGRPQQLEEYSHFERKAGTWYYVDAKPLPGQKNAAAKPGRNAPCPCGSGKKYKQCCLK